MADQDNSLDILIKLGVIGQADAKAALDLLKETGQAANQTASSTSDLSDEMKQQAEWSKRVRVALGEQAEGAEKLELSHHQLHNIFHRLTEEAPALGMAANFFLNPWVAAGVSFGVMIQQVVGHFEHLKEMANEQVDVTGFKTAASGLGDMSKAATDAIAAMDALRISLKILDEAEQTSAGKAKDETEALERQAGIAGKLRKAHLDLALSKVEADKASGKITPEEAAAKEEKLKRESARAEVDADADAAQKKIAIQEKAQKELQGKIDSMEGGAYGVQGKKSAADTAAEAAKQNAAAAKKAADDQQADILKYAGTSGWTREKDGFEETKQKQLYYAQAAAEERADDAAKAAKAAGLEVEDFTKRLQEAHAQLKQINESLPLLKQAAAENAAGASATAKTGDEQAQTDLLSKLLGTAGGGTALKMAGLAKARRLGQRMSPDQSAELEAYIKNLTGGEGSDSAAGRAATNDLLRLGGTKTGATDKNSILQKLFAEGGLQNLLGQIGTSGQVTADDVKRLEDYAKTIGGNQSPDLMKRIVAVAESLMDKHANTDASLKDLHASVAMLESRVKSLANK